MAPPVGVRAPKSPFISTRIPLLKRQRSNPQTRDRLKPRPLRDRRLEPRRTTSGRRLACGAVAGWLQSAHAARRPRSSSSALELSLSPLSVRPERPLTSSRPLPSVYDVRSMRHPRYYSLHSEAASSGKELLGRLSLWRVQVDRGHRPLGAVFGLAPPARLYRGSRAVSRKLPTGQLPTGDR